jgi:hypothetical protein
VLDGTDSGIHRLLHGQRHRNVAGGTQAVGTRTAHRVQEQRWRQRAVGDLDEVHAVALEPGQRRVQVGRAAYFQRAFPDRLDAFDLGAGTEQLRTLEAAVGDLPPPLQHLLRQVARAVADGGDAVCDVQRQQRLVLFDQLRATAEVHVHVPKAGNEVATLAIDLAWRRPRPGDGTVVAHRNDIVAPYHHRLVGNGGGPFDIDHGGVADDHIGLFGGEDGRSEGKQQRDGGQHDRVHGRRTTGRVTAPYGAAGPIHQLNFGMRRIWFSNAGQTSPCIAGRATTLASHAFTAGWPSTPAPT